MAQQTVSTLSVFALLCEESPIDRHSSWVSDDRFDHAPDEKNEKDIKDDEQDDVGSGFE